MSKTRNWDKEGNTHIGMSNTPQTLPYHEVIAGLALQYSQDESDILDIGCGRGQISKLVSAHGNRKLSIADAYQLCLDEVGSLVNPERTFLLDEEIFDIDSKIIDKKYDIVILSHVLEHLKDPIGAIKKIKDITKPGGMIIIAVPNPVRPNVFFSNIFKHHYVNKGHVYAWDMSHWRNFLETINKLDVISYAHDFIQIPGCYRFPFLQKIGKALAKMVPWWSFSNIAVIRMET